MGLVLFVAFAGLLLFIVRRTVDAETAKNVKFLGARPRINTSGSSRHGL